MAEEKKKKLYDAWSQAHAFDVNGKIYPPGSMGSPDSDDEFLSLWMVDQDFLIYELLVDDSMIEDGSIDDDTYTLIYNDKFGTTTVTPLFPANWRKK